MDALGAGGARVTLAPENLWRIGRGASGPRSRGTYCVAGATLEEKTTL